jgi:hypothetical protein
MGVMNKKQYFLMIDTETCQSGKVVDFAGIICDRHGEIFHECAVIIDGQFCDENDPLFFNPLADPNDFWSLASRERREKQYKNFLTNGTRMLASVAAVNRWLDKANNKYNPILTAYNLKFDIGACAKTGIDLTSFNKSFCLWNVSFALLASSKKYRQFILENHYFNAPTSSGNMTLKMTAETVSNFINNHTLKEPHTALEDLVYCEIPILKYILSKKPIKWALNNEIKYNWKLMQVKNCFKAI